MGKDSKLGIEGVWIVVALLLLLAFMFWKEADAAEFEVGPAFLSGEFSEGGALIFNQRVGRFDVGGGYVSKQQCHCTYPASLDENIFFHAQRVVQWRALEAGLGAAYFQNTNRALGKNLTWSLSLGLRFDHFSIKVRHFSNAGSGSPNLGQDLLAVGWRF